MRGVWRWYRNRPLWLQWTVGLFVGLLVLAVVVPSPESSSEDSVSAPSVTSNPTATAARAAAREPASPPPGPSGRRDRIVRVTDGDTVVLAGLGRTRLIGVDTPEVFAGAECYGPEASAFTKRMLPAGTNVRYRFDVERRDRYQRALAYLYKGGVFVNAELVRRGYAMPLTIPPNVRYADRFAALSREARASEQGLWAPDTCAREADRPEKRDADGTADRGSSTGSASGRDLSGDKDCGSFATQAEAQRYYEAKGGPASDPDRLDADRDGSACEDLPAAGGSADAGNATGGASSLDLSGDKDCGSFATRAEAQRYYEAKGGPASDPDRLDADRDGAACEDLP